VVIWISATMAAARCACAAGVDGFERGDQRVVDLVARGPRRHALDETTHVEEFDKAR
jgi:hypothetical protein